MVDSLVETAVRELRAPWAEVCSCIKQTPLCENVACRSHLSAPIIHRDFMRCVTRIQILFVSSISLYNHQLLESFPGCERK